LLGPAATWVKADDNLPPRAITQLAVDPTNAAITYCTVSGFSGFPDTLGHVFRTTDHGITWTDVSGNLPNVPANDIVLDPDLPGTVYVATYVGVLLSAVAGMTWSSLGTGFPNVIVTGLKFHNASRTLRAATYSPIV